MQCPVILKGKKPCEAELQTKRTMANGSKVRRERACPKCHARFWTVEQFEKDIQAAEFQQEEAIRALDVKIRALESQLISYEGVFVGLGNLIEVARKKK